MRKLTQRVEKIDELLGAIWQAPMITAKGDNIDIDIKQPLLIAILKRYKDPLCR